MSSAAERFLAEFGGDWDYKAALKASSKASAAAPFRLESLAQPEAAENVAANPATPEQNADLKARRDLEDEIAMHAMLREDEDDTEEQARSRKYENHKIVQSGSSRRW